MSFEKVLDVRIFGVTDQNSTVYLPIGDSSGGTFTSKANPLRGTLLWDSCMYVLQGVSVAGGATGGSYTVTVCTNAVSGYTGLPIANATIGPLTKRTVILDNLHKSAASPMPTHLLITQTAAGGGLWAQCTALAKQYRGTLGTAGGRATSERIVQGNMVIGSSANKQFSTDRGFDEDTTLTVGGASCSNVGMNRMRLWDTALYWAVAGVSMAGTHDVDIIGFVGGNTVSIASTGTGGALDAAGEKLPLANNFYGQSPNPFRVIWTEVNAGGVSDARVVVLAKTGRGSLAKQ